MKNIIYEGSDSSTLRKAAYEKAAELLNGKEVNDSNIRTFADLLVIKPENGVIGVWEARIVTEFASLSPVSSEHRVVCILDMQAATVNFQNALLKVLEEAPVCFVITTTGSLLDTVYSRSERKVVGKAPERDVNAGRSEKQAPALSRIMECVNRNSASAILDAFGVLNARKKSVFETLESRDVIEIIQEVRDWFYDKGLHSGTVNGVNAAYSAIKACDSGLQALEKGMMTKASFEDMIEEIFCDYWFEFIDVSKAS